MKTLIIIKREFLTRVRKKSFILLTILIPLLFIGLMFGITFLSTTSISTKKIATYIEHPQFDNAFVSNRSLEYIPLDSEPSGSEIIDLLHEGIYDGYLYIHDFDINSEAQIQLLTSGELGLEFENSIQSTINETVRTIKMENAGIAPTRLHDIEKNSVRLSTVNTEGKSSSSEIALMIGYISGFLLYFFMLFYGMNVMNSVMEEKTNRIAEIIVSSVSPFQLMFGKIIGVALVGLTQFLIWGVLLFIIMIITGLSGFVIDPSVSESMISGASSQDMPIDLEMVERIGLMISQVKWLSIISWFLFYFLGGYFLYAALYAAVGSLVNENMQEGQQFTIPITLPIIFAMVVMSSTVQDPHNNLAVFGSIFPLTSPIVMMARIPYGVPGWQLLLSAGSLIVGFIFTTWMAAKIYRTGILMYGKKITFKEVGKWIFKK